jgi:hypothetical protein
MTLGQVERDQRRRDGLQVVCFPLSAWTFLLQDVTVLQCKPWL